MYGFQNKSKPEWWLNNALIVRCKACHLLAQALVESSRTEQKKYQNNKNSATGHFFAGWQSRARSLLTQKIPTSNLEKYIRKTINRVGLGAAEQCWSEWRSTIQMEGWGSINCKFSLLVAGLSTISFPNSEEPQKNKMSNICIYIYCWYLGVLGSFVWQNCFDVQLGQLQMGHVLLPSSPKWASNDNHPPERELTSGSRVCVCTGLHGWNPRDILARIGDKHHIINSRWLHCTS